jgi:thermitase
MHRSSPPLTRRFVAAFAVVAAIAFVSPAQAASNRILVKFKQDLSPLQVRRLERMIGAVQEGRVPGLGVHVLRIPGRREAAVVGMLERGGLVEFAEPDGIAFRVSARSARLVPTDPFWSREWGANAIGAPGAWAKTRGNPAVVIATLDSGVDLSHPDLQGALLPGFDFANEDDVPADDNGHGTAVAGVIAARAGNGVGISGICPQCSLLPVKVASSAGTASDSAVASGMTWAADHGARVINVSLGGSYFSQTVADAVHYATRKGVIVVSSAGNSGGSALSYPAANEGVLSVAATDRANRLYSWSNYGPWVDVAAPGCAFTTALAGLYADFCGTSASAPLVAGLVGLALSAAPRATSPDVEAAVEATARGVAGLAFGRVDAAATIARLGRGKRSRPGTRSQSATRAQLRGAGLTRQAALRALPLERRRQGR